MTPTEKKYAKHLGELFLHKYSRYDWNSSNWTFTEVHAIPTRIYKYGEKYFYELQLMCEEDILRPIDKKNYNYPCIDFHRSSKIIS